MARLHRGSGGIPGAASAGHVLRLQEAGWAEERGSVHFTARLGEDWGARSDGGRFFTHILNFSKLVVPTASDNKCYPGSEK